MARTVLTARLNGATITHYTTNQAKEPRVDLLLPELTGLPLGSKPRTNSYEIWPQEQQRRQKEARAAGLSRQKGERNVFGARVSSSEARRRVRSGGGEICIETEGPPQRRVRQPPPTSFIRPGRREKESGVARSAEVSPTREFMQQRV